MTKPASSLYAHDLVNSLYVIKGMIENFLLNQEEGHFPNEKEGFEKSQEVLKRTFFQVDRALGVVKKLGQTREEGRQGGSSKTSILQAWQEALLIFEKEGAGKGIEILERISDSFPAIQCSKEDLKEIFYHLSQNAFQALAEKGRLVIRAQVTFSTREEAFAVIQIADTGPGIPESTLHRLFHPFFTTKPRGVGEGLGLYLTRQLVRRNQGRITVSSFPGSGTTFTLEFPLAKHPPK